MLKQKFRRGDLVHIPEGSCERYFEQGCNAVILGSYDEFYGHGDIFKYEVLLEDERRVAWYDEDQLVLIKKGEEQLIYDIKERKIKREAERIIREEDLEDLCEDDIIILLRFIGFDYSVSNNYFALWDEVYPLFREIREAESPDKLREQYPVYDIEGVWKMFHNRGENKKNVSKGKFVYSEGEMKWVEES